MNFLERIVGKRSKNKLQALIGRIVELERHLAANRSEQEQAQAELQAEILGGGSLDQHTESLVRLQIQEAALADLIAKAKREAEILAGHEQREFVPARLEALEAERKELLRQIDLERLPEIVRLAKRFGWKIQLPQPAIPGTPARLQEHKLGAPPRRAQPGALSIPTAALTQEDLDQILAATEAEPAAADPTATRLAAVMKELGEARVLKGSPPPLFVETLLAAARRAA